MSVWGMLHGGNDDRRAPPPWASQPPFVRAGRAVESRAMAGHYATK
jgi:hypothetical protein